jgi:hypothetical protein
MQPLASCVVATCSNWYSGQATHKTCKAMHKKCIGAFPPSFSPSRLRAKPWKRSASANTRPTQWHCESTIHTCGAPWYVITIIACRTLLLLNNVLVALTAERIQYRAILILKMYVLIEYSYMCVCVCCVCVWYARRCVRKQFALSNAGWHNPGRNVWNATSKSLSQASRSVPTWPDKDREKLSCMCKATVNNALCITIRIEAFA